MTVLTASGYYLHGTPTRIVSRLRALASSGVTVGARENAAGIVAECDRIARYRAHIGPAMADVAASNLLFALEEEGYLLLQSH